MTKKTVIFLFLAGLLFSANNMYAGEWDVYMGEVQVVFACNLKTENSRFPNGKTFSEWGIEDVNAAVARGDRYRLTKLPKDLESFIWRQLAEYTLEEGDVFIIQAGYEWTSPKLFTLTLRITDKGKSFTWYGTRRF